MKLKNIEHFISITFSIEKIRNWDNVTVEATKLHKKSIEVPSLRPRSSSFRQEPRGANRQQGIAPIKQELGNNLTSTSRYAGPQEPAVKDGPVQIETMLLENDLLK